MSHTKYLTSTHLQILKKARDTYGETNQILVSCEELTELAAVCAKYPRYTDHEKAHNDLYAKALDEVADVLIVLDHVINIFDIKPYDLQQRIHGKVSRLEHWMNTSSSMEQTTIDREVPGQTSLEDYKCQSCVFVNIPDHIFPCSDCHNFDRYAKATPCVGCAHNGDYKQLKEGGACAECVKDPGCRFVKKEN